ncbi:MAG: stage sporulation protein [Bacillota bacterium]|jgi:stage V sporulation protein AD
MKNSTWFFNDVHVLANAAVAGPFEGQGELAGSFDMIYQDIYMGQPTWEKAERKMLSDAINLAVQKAGKEVALGGVELCIAGDLLNQNISASFVGRELSCPFIGVYGACSTAMLSLALASLVVSSGACKSAVAGASSHNCTSEKQYRYPTEYGSQKPGTAQWTVTGAGACVVGQHLEGISIRSATIGEVVDFGISNPLDMGSAMAPAAVQVIKQHFLDTGLKVEDYDLIATGDLGKIGHKIARDLLNEEGYPVADSFVDCGLMIYSDQQQTFAGGSGCASSAIVTYGYLLDKLKCGALKKLLVVGTGALLSPISYQQGETIPAIAHAVSFEA